MEFASPHQHFTAEVVKRGLLQAAPFELIDVGCSGGISPLWRAFEPSLRAIGVDPVVNECARLACAERNPNVRYVAAFVGLPDDHPFSLRRKGRAPTEGNPWDRLSADAASKILNSRIKQEEKLSILNSWQTESLAQIRKHSLDDLARRENLTGADFIKIDIDSDDLAALFSAEKLIRESPVLGLVLEVNYYGGADPTEHTFHNTDRLMREWGFDLFGITSRRYGAAALPSRFEHNMPAQTVSGRPYQGDALYLRDAIALEDARRLPPLPPAKLLKLACLFESFSLPDFAAELLQRHARHIGVNLASSLDLLTRSVRADELGYHEHMRHFQKDPTRFYRDGAL